VEWTYGDCGHSDSVSSGKFKSTQCTLTVAQRPNKQQVLCKWTNIENNLFMSVTNANRAAVSTLALSSSTHLTLKRAFIAKERAP